MPKLAQDLLTTFGETVKRARGLKGWQLNDLANRIADIDAGKPGHKAKAPARSFLSDIEKGKRHIGPVTVGKLIAALELDESWIDRFLAASIPADGEETRCACSGNARPAPRGWTPLSLHMPRL